MVMEPSDKPSSSRSHGAVREVQVRTKPVLEKVIKKPRFERFDGEHFSFPELLRFNERHAVNYTTLPPDCRPFDALPTEILDTILSLVATSHSCLQTDVLSSHIYKARRLNKRLQHLVDIFLLDRPIFGRYHYKTVPATSSELQNFIAASRNDILNDSLSELYLPIQLQTTDLATAQAWHSRFASRPDPPKHTKWAYLYESSPPYAKSLIHKEGMTHQLLRRDREGFSILGSVLKSFRNLRSLKVRTIPAPTMKIWESYGPHAGNSEDSFTGSGYTPLTTLLTTLSAANIPLTHVSITGLALALLEDSFAFHLPSWSVLGSITHLSLTLLEGEDFADAPADVLIPFLSSFHALQSLEISGCTWDRRTIEFPASHLLEIYTIHPRPHLHSLRLRSITTNGWALKKLFAEHAGTLRNVHIDDVTLLDRAWFSLINYMRGVTETGPGWERVVLRQSKDKWNEGAEAFHDSEHAGAMSEIVSRWGDGEGYNVARMELSRYVMDLRAPKKGSEGGEEEAEGEENVVYDPGYA